MCCNASLQVFKLYELFGGGGGEQKNRQLSEKPSAIVEDLKENLSKKWYSFGRVPR